MARPAGFWLNRWALDDLVAAKHLTRTEIAATADVSLGHLSDMASWRRSASMTVVRRLAAAVGCAPETLFPQLAAAERSRLVGAPL